MEEKEIQARLEKLPRWAIIAFAGRCAARVLPMVQASSEMEATDRSLVQMAVNSALNLANSNDVTVA